MALRPSWQGTLKLSLVTAPVALYTATSDKSGVSFNLINPETNNRIKMITTDPETGPVDRSSLVKGYEVEKGRYILVTEEEIRSVRLESTKTITIERFVPESDIDRTFWDSPYYMAPDGKVGEDAFKVIREAMRSEGQVALGRVVMSTRERILALEPKGKGIVAHTIRSREEVRDPSEVFDRIDDAPADANMVAIAKQIIQQHEGPFDPTLFVDRYADALRALIKEKEKGAVAVGASSAPEPQVVDLMAALRASLQGAGQRPAAPGRSARARSEKPAAKPSPRRRAS